MITHQVSSVARGAVTLACHVITPRPIVTLTLEVTLLTIGAGWAGVGTDCSLKCRNLGINESATFSLMVKLERRKDERLFANIFEQEILSKPHLWMPKNM